MSGGRLVVLDHLGRDVKAYPLAEGLVTIGSDPGCDIRVLLPTVSPHHATVLVHDNQTVVSSMTAGETLVNGVPVSVTSLRHCDELGVGGRTLRWEYHQPNTPQTLQPQSALARSAGRAGPSRRSGRASVHGSTSGKQVAIVQPQRRDTNEHEAGQVGAGANISHSRSSRHSEPGSGAQHMDCSHRKSTPRASPKNLNDTTKASLWIESRKTPRVTPRRVASARKITPLRLAVLKKAQSVHKIRVTKIQAPSKIDHTKQAAIMLMTGHTPKPRQPSPKNRPSFVVKKLSLGMSTSRRGNISRANSLGVTPKRSSTRASARYSEGASGDKSIETLESSLLAGPKKSALKKSSKKGTRKSESIKFDFSNLENPEDRSSSIASLVDTTKDPSNRSTSDEDLSLHYSDTSSTRSPSPRRPIHSRSSRILEKSLGMTFSPSPMSERSAASPRSPGSRKSSRGSLIVEKALENSTSENSRYSRRTSKSLSDQSYKTTIAPVRENRTRSLRASNRNLESYSIVDLISMDSNDSDRSMYDSVGSESGAATFTTLPPGSGRSTRSNISLLGSSTPYADRTQPITPQISARSGISRKGAASLTTPENLQKRVSINSPRISRVSRSRSRINDSDVLLLEDEDSSPKSSRRISKSSVGSPIIRKSVTLSATPDAVATGTITPVNRSSPEEATTPVLSIQNLLEQSQSSLTSWRLQKRRKANLKRKTIGAVLPKSKMSRNSIKSRSLMATSRRSLKAQKTSSDYKDKYQPSQDEETVTPKSAVKPFQEGVKNKHSTAKKPQSKRSIIDNLDESDFVKQLFNSPVKRKLSQSMTEFSRKKLFDDDDVRPISKRATMPRTPDVFLMDCTQTFTPEIFVSPLSTPRNSPNVAGLKRLFEKNTPENDLRNVSGVQTLLRTPRTRKSIKNDLTDVAGLKNVFALLPQNDLTDVSGVKSLFRPTRKSPKNSYDEVRGVKRIFRGADARTNLSDVSGVEELFRETPDVDTTFDQLIGKPRIRSYTKSKSYTRGTKPRQKRNAKSLHDSISLITDNVEEWLANELKKRIHKDANPSAGTRSINRPNLTRELQKLSTNTIEGSTPLLVSRSRNATISTSIRFEAPELKKSASDIYSAHTLPIKKRSLVKAANKSGNANRLPIKKRTVMHSTPVKGRLNVTLNVSELGRVSPIAPVEKTADVETAARLTHIPKTKRGKALQVDSHELEVVLKENPLAKQTRASRLLRKNPDREESQKLTRYTKETQQRMGRKALLGVVNNASARKLQSGVLKITTDNTKHTEVNNSSKIVRKTRSKAKQVSATVSGPITRDVNKNERSVGRISQSKDIKKPIKNTRAKARRSSIVITKPSTRMKPISIKLVNDNEINGGEGFANVRTRRTRKNIENVQPDDDKVTQPRRTRSTYKKTTNADMQPNMQQSKAKKAGVKRNVREQKQSEDSASEPLKKRGRKTATDNKDIQNRLPKTVVAESNEEERPRAARSTRNQKAMSERNEPVIVVPDTSKQKRKITAAVDIKSAQAKSAEEIGTKTRRGRKSKETSKTNVVTNKRGRGAQRNNVNYNTIKTGKKDLVEDKTANVNALQGRRTRAVRSENVTDNSVPRRKKNAVPDAAAAGESVDASAGRRGNVQNDSKQARRGAKKVIENIPEMVDPAKGARGRKPKNDAQTVSEPLPTRGRKVAAPAEELPKRRGRKPKAQNVEEPTPMVEVVKRAGRKRKVEVEEPTIKEAPTKRARTTRAAAALVEQPAGGRSRRR